MAHDGSTDTTDDDDPECTQTDDGTYCAREDEVFEFSEDFCRDCPKRIARLLRALEVNPTWMPVAERYEARLLRGHQQVKEILATARRLSESLAEIAEALEREERKARGESGLDLEPNAAATAPSSVTEDDAALRASHADLSNIDSTFIDRRRREIVKSIDAPPNPLGGGS